MTGYRPRQLAKLGVIVFFAGIVALYFASFHGWAYGHECALMNGAAPHCFFIDYDMGVASTTFLVGILAILASVVWGIVRFLRPSAEARLVR